MADAILKPTHRLFQDLTGRKFGRLTVVSYAGRSGHNHLWGCTCQCGSHTRVLSCNLVKGNTRSCGCLHRELTGDARRTHGRTGTSEYHIYQSMLARCYSDKAISYPNYGARGITVCDRWRFGDGALGGFECFLRDVGERPSRKHSLDRRENDGNYEPSNVRWATKVEQHRNTRANRHVMFRGEKMILEDAIRLSGLNRSTVSMRINTYKWSIEKALSTPSKRKCRGNI